MIDQEKFWRLPKTDRAKKYIEFENKLRLLGYDGQSQSLLKCGKSLVVGDYAEMTVKIYNNSESQTTWYGGYYGSGYFGSSYGLGSSYQTSILPREMSYKVIQSVANMVQLYVDDNKNSYLELKDIFDSEKNSINMFMTDKKGLEAIKSGGTYKEFKGKINTLKISGHVQTAKGCIRTIRALQRVCRVLDMQELTIDTIQEYDSLFKDSELERIILNKTSKNKVIKFNSVFKGCSKLEQIDLNGLDLSKVEEMCETFKDCVKLKNVDFQHQLDNNESLQNIEGLFQGCESLGSINFGGFNSTQGLNPAFHVFDRVNPDIKLRTISDDIKKYLENRKKNSK